MIDTHAHLNDERFDKDVHEVIEQAREAGVMKMIVPGLDLATSKKGIDLANNCDGIFALVGVHPEEVIQNKEFKVTVDELTQLVESSKYVVGIGEIGMDFYWDKEKKTVTEQKELFTLQLQIAHAMKLPVMIHSRAAETEMRELLDGLDFEAAGQFHCFGESESFLRYVLGKGFYVSFCGNVTYKSAEELREMAKKVPLERLLLETDSPYLAPEGRRGERNTPASVRITAEFLAKLRGESFEKLVDVTSKNAERLYGLRQ